jgi:calcineurin-like phosphoesterase family protein
LTAFLKNPKISSNLKSILGGSVICIPTNHDEAFVMDKQRFIDEYDGGVQNMYQFNLDQSDNNGIRLVRR